jgi:hypothetical protein
MPINADIAQEKFGLAMRPSRVSADVPLAFLD